MNLEPVIDVRFRRFQQDLELEELNESQAFERFVNFNILSGHQPDVFDGDREMLDALSVGGPNDMGIDGIAIKLNGLFVMSEEDINDVLEKFKRANVEFIFIQSKQSTSFDAAGFQTFGAGVRDFLSEVHRAPMNDSVRRFLKLKDYLLSEDIVFLWDENPAVRLYYVAMGKSRSNNHLAAHSEQLHEDILNLNNTYGRCNIHLVDAAILKTICDNNEHAFSAALETVDTMQLTAVDGVDNSCLALCYANEFVKLLTTDDGIIRKSLFNDNVRDFQGANSINEEIFETLKAAPEKFGLLNNGITIVCDNFLSSNRNLTLKNPQVVNGCQTSHVLYTADQAGFDISKVPLHLKIISTNNLDITNQVVRGTNRQNIVMDETFESTRQFHKDLEEFFSAVSAKHVRLYYERRSKQYHHNPKIGYSERINLRTLTQYFVAMFINQPHMSHRHESKLLKEYRNVIYQDHHSRLPYYVAAVTSFRLEDLLGHRKLPAVTPFRAHLATIFRELVAGPVPNINHEKIIDRYCNILLKILDDKSESEKIFSQAVDIFAQARKKWVALGESPHGIKDRADFTTFMITEVPAEIDGLPELIDDGRLVGRILKVIYDRNGEICGFISRSSEDIFFHSKENPNVDFRSLEGNLVLYEVTKNYNGREMAVSIAVAD